MFVKNIMIPKHKCVIIQHHVDLKEALETLTKHEIDAAPVLKGEEFVGVITKYRIYEGLFEMDYQEKEDYLNKVTTEEIARKRYLVVQKDEIFEQAIYQLKNNPVAGVLDEDDEFLGIITRYDMFEEFRSSLGADRGGVRLTITSVECEGRLALLAELAAAYHENIISLITFDTTDTLVRRIVLKIENNEHTKQFLNKLEKSGFKVVHSIEIKPDSQPVYV